MSEEQGEAKGEEKGFMNRPANPASDEQSVAAFLKANPDFLLRQPEIFNQLRLTHESGGAISLIERQVEQLREQNQKLLKQMNQLVRVAADNERLMHRLHDLTLELMIHGQLGTFFERLCEILTREFEADILNITLLDHDVSGGERTPLTKADRDDPEFKQFLPYLEKGETVCGRLSRSKLDFLFRNRAQWVQSTAVVPLGSFGLLAIGSSDPSRFYPGMGTLFLDLLGSVIKRRLEMATPEKIRRTA